MCTNIFGPSKNLLLKDFFTYMDIFSHLFKQSSVSLVVNLLNFLLVFRSMFINNDSYVRNQNVFQYKTQAPFLQWSYSFLYIGIRPTLVAIICNAGAHLIWRVAAGPFADFSAEPVWPEYTEPYEMKRRRALADTGNNKSSNHNYKAANHFS